MKCQLCNKEIKGKPCYCNKQVMCLSCFNSNKVTKKPINPTPRVHWVIKRMQEDKEK